MSLKRHYSREETHLLIRLLLLINRLVPATPYNDISNVATVQPTQAVLRFLCVLANPPGRLAALALQLDVSAAAEAAAAYPTGSSLLDMSGECDGEQGKRTGAGAG